MASAELLKITHRVEGKVKGVDDKVKDVRGDVQDVGEKVLDVDDKLDRVNRSSSPNLITLHSEPSPPSQGTSSEIVFYDGFRLQIRQSIIILRRKLITTVQPSGSFKEVYIRTGNPLAPFCGCTESVRSSQLLLRYAITHHHPSFCSGIGEECTLVRPSSTSLPHET